jgi:hypothetical protein
MYMWCVVVCVFILWKWQILESNDDTPKYFMSCYTYMDSSLPELKLESTEPASHWRVSNQQQLFPLKHVAGGGGGMHGCSSAAIKLTSNRPVPEQRTLLSILYFTLRCSCLNSYGTIELEVNNCSSQDEQKGCHKWRRTIRPAEGSVGSAATVPWVQSLHSV